MLEHVQAMPTTFKVGGLPVKVERRMLILLTLVMPLILAVVARWRRPQRSLGEALVVGWLYWLVLLTPDATHIGGHAISARKAGAPMDAVYVPLGMPRTIYYNNTVPPATHMRRALGGPVASILGFVVGSLLYRLASPESLSRELSGLAVAGHGLIGAGSLLPIPGVDGATILHWWRRQRSQEHLTGEAAQIGP